VQVALWTITFVFFVVSALKVLRQRQWQRPLTGFVSAGLLLHVLTHLQPQALIGANLTALLAAILWWRGVWGNFPQTAISSASTPARAAYESTECASNALTPGHACCLLLRREITFNEAYNVLHGRLVPLCHVRFCPGCSARQAGVHRVEVFRVPFGR
jgi:hypothetical protein